MTDPRNFLVNSNYPLDKIVYMTSGSMLVPVTFSGDLTIAHGLGFMPLPLILWSNDVDFTTTYTSGDATYNSGAIDGSSFTLGQSYNVSADSTNLVINQYNNSGSTKTVYYRVYCFPPSTLDEDTEIEHTSSLGNNFILNTDYNYMKLAFTGALSSGTPSFSHNFGYIPTAMIWGVVSGFATPLVSSQIIVPFPAGNFMVDVTTTAIIWTGAGTTFDTIEYRIYAETGV